MKHCVIGYVLSDVPEELSASIISVLYGVNIPAAVFIIINMNQRRGPIYSQKMREQILLLNHPKQ